MKIALIYSELPHLITGPRNSLTLLADAIKPYFKKVSVFSTHECEPFSYNNVEVNSLEDRVLSEYDLFLITGVWWPQNIKLAKKLVKNNVPYIISPRSSLMKSSFKKSSFKKAIYYLLRARSYIKNAAAIHFLTEDEKKNSFFSSKGFVVGNIVNDPHILETVDFNKTSTKQLMISFLGRLDIKHKGLDIFLDALKYCKNSLIKRRVTIKINGPEFRGSKKVLESIIKKNELDDIVKVGPKISGSEKAEFLHNTDVFVHTSRYEGQPQAVMEAMMSQCAILVTPGTNMSTIVRRSECGIVTELNSKQIAKGLLLILDSDIDKMKRNAYQFAHENFNSTNVGVDFSNKINSIFDSIKTKSD